MDASFVLQERVGLIFERAPAGIASLRITAPLIRGAVIRDPYCRRAGYLSSHASPTGTGAGGTLVSECQNPAFRGAATRDDGRRDSCDT